jgi:hypothetical protein
MITKTPKDYEWTTILTKDHSDYAFTPSSNGTELHSERSNHGTIKPTIVCSLSKDSYKEFNKNEFCYHGHDLKNVEAFLKENAGDVEIGHYLVVVGKDINGNVVGVIPSTPIVAAYRKELKQTVHCPMYRE